jgi:CDP-diacylglycerol--glycerol-3-phosphate 3-phosphatidyltransferase
MSEKRENIVAIASKKAALVKPVLNKRLEKMVRHPFGRSTLLAITNALTLIRIFISPIFLVVYLEYDALGISYRAFPYVLLFLLFSLELSDALDGYLARKWDQVTDLGKVLDPMADSISQISIFLTFSQPPISLPLFIVFIFIYRDSIISTLRTVCALRGMALAARSSGKCKSIIQGIAALSITACLIPYTVGTLSMVTLQRVALYITLVAAAFSLYAGIEYLCANFSFVKKALIRRKKRSRNY